MAETAGGVVDAAGAAEEGAVAAGASTVCTGEAGADVAAGLVGFVAAGAGGSAGAFEAAPSDPVGRPVEM